MLIELISKTRTKECGCWCCSSYLGDWQALVEQVARNLMHGEHSASILFGERQRIANVRAMSVGHKDRRNRLEGARHLGWEVGITEPRVDLLSSISQCESSTTPH